MHSHGSLVHTHTYDLQAQEKVHEIQELRRRQHPDIQSDIDVAEQHIMDLCHEIELLKQQETVRDSVTPLVQLPDPVDKGDYLIPLLLKLSAK